VGITVCASSGGPGAKTGLYKVGDVIRRLTVRETLGMFGFPADYNFAGTTDENSLFYLGNSIVVNVPLSLVPAIEAYFLRGFTK
jgi:site-specific DNA-cytosine methylase